MLPLDGGQLAASTIRGYQTDLRLFSECLCDGRYGWAAECEKAFGPGAHPVAVCHEWNTIELDKHMMVVADLAGGNAGAIEDALEAACSFSTVPTDNTSHDARLGEMRANCRSARFSG